MKSFLSLAIGLFVCLQTSFSQTTMRMMVHEESKPCRRMMEQTCLQVLKEGSTEWELFYDNIKGFTFEPGYRYEITVIRTERPEPVPQDLSKYLYKLDKIISKISAAGSGQDGMMEMMAPDYVWKVASINGTQLNTNDFYFKLNSDSTRIEGRSGCNEFSTSIAFNKKKTKVKTTSVASTTKMACSDDIMKLESDFHAALADKTFKISQTDGQWTWKRKGKVVLVLEQFFREEPRMIVDPAPNMSTAWNYFDGKNLKVIQLEGKTLTNSNAQLMFDTRNHRFTGNNGCNRISGSFDSYENAISFSEVISTKMACTDETVAATERSIQKILGSSGLTIDFAEQVLNIYDASGKLVLMLAAGK